MRSIDSLEHDLERVVEMLSGAWITQNNEMDKKTNFIYQMGSLDACLKEIERTGTDQNYALHRWYNAKTSIACEYIFCEFGAVHDRDPYNHDTDIYINKVPFDVKLTVYPQKLKDRRFDLHTRAGKDEMIRWFYENQSQGNRKQLLNRLYVVCDGKSNRENLRMKSNFPLMRERIGEFMKDASVHGVQNITMDIDGKHLVLKSDIILLD
jgi:hypothetical protein